MKNNDLTKKVEHYKHENFLSHIKMGREIVTFDDIEIEKINFIAIKVLFFRRYRYLESITI